MEDTAPATCDGAAIMKKWYELIRDEEREILDGRDANRFGDATDNLDQLFDDDAFIAFLTPLAYMQLD